jgi:hypothetical protein
MRSSKTKERQMTNKKERPLSRSQRKGKSKTRKKKIGLAKLI